MLVRENISRGEIFVTFLRLFPRIGTRIYSHTQDRDLFLGVQNKVSLTYIPTSDNGKAGDLHFFGSKKREKAGENFEKA